jgi:riboflavin synthase alpha subunit
MVLLGACSDGSSGAILGTWSGSAAGFTVTAEVQSEFSNGDAISVMGIMSTDRSACFTNATMAGTLARTSVDLIARGTGTLSTDTFVRVTGELAGDTISGRLDVTATPTECVAAGPIVLSR